MMISEHLGEAEAQRLHQADHDGHRRRHRAGGDAEATGHRRCRQRTLGPDAVLRKPSPRSPG